MREKVQYSKVKERAEQQRRDRENRPYRVNEALCRQLVSQGNYETAPLFQPVRQGSFTPGTSTTYATIRLVCCREIRTAMYSVHDAVIVDRESGPDVHLIRGVYDLSRAAAEALL